MPRAARKSKAASGGLASGPVAKKSKASSEVTEDLAQPDSQSFADNVKTAANVTAIVAGVSGTTATDSKETLLVTDPGLMSPCDNLSKNQAIRPEQLSMEPLTNLPGMTPQSQALLPSLEEMMNWPGSDPISGGGSPMPNFLAEAEASFPHMSILGPTGLLPLPAWLPPKPPENEEDLRCPKCDIVYYSKSSIKNHIQVCKYVRKGPPPTGVPAVNSSNKTSGIQNPQVKVEAAKKRREVVDGFIKLNDDEKGSLKILEKSCFNNDPEFYEDFHAPVQKGDQVKLVYSEKTYTCKQCDEDFVGIKPFARHLYAHTFVRTAEEELPILCAGCGKEFLSKEELKKHAETVKKKSGNPKCHESLGNAKVLFKCQLCSLRFTRKENLRNHLRQYAALGRPPKDVKIFKCPSCPQIWGGEGLMKTHKLSHVKPTLAFKCLGCKNIFSSKPAIASHKCPAKSQPKGPTQTPDILQKAVNSINGTKGQPLPTASTTVSTAATNVSTKLPTKEELLYKCPKCPQTFKTRASLTGHSRVHSNYSKSFRCTWCKAVFYDDATLKEHVATHDKDVAKAKICKPCDRRFNNDHNLKLHLWHTHNMTLLDNEVWVKDPNKADGMYSVQSLAPNTPMPNQYFGEPQTIPQPNTSLAAPGGTVVKPSDLMMPNNKGSEDLLQPTTTSAK